MQLSPSLKKCTEILFFSVVTVALLAGIVAMFGPDPKIEEPKFNVVLSANFNDRIGEFPKTTLDTVQELSMKKTGFTGAIKDFGRKGDQLALDVEVITKNGMVRLGHFYSYKGLVIAKMVRNANDPKKWDIYTYDDLSLRMGIKEATEAAQLHLALGLYYATKPTEEELQAQHKADWAIEAEKYAAKAAEVNQPAN
jgi:hypothetical protein